MTITQTQACGGCVPLPSLPILPYHMCSFIFLAEHLGFSYCHGSLRLALPPWIVRVLPYYISATDFQKQEPYIGNVGDGWDRKSWVVSLPDEGQVSRHRYCQRLETATGKSFPSQTGYNIPGLNHTCSSQMPNATTQATTPFGEDARPCGTEPCRVEEDCIEGLWVMSSDVIPVSFNTEDWLELCVWFHLPSGSIHKIDSHGN